MQYARGGERENLSNLLCDQTSYKIDDHIMGSLSNPDQMFFWQVSKSGNYDLVSSQGQLFSPTFIVARDSIGNSCNDFREKKFK